MSGMLVSRSYRAVAMLVSISDGLALEGLFGAILFRAGVDMMATGQLCGCLLTDGYVGGVEFSICGLCETEAAKGFASLYSASVAVQPFSVLRPNVTSPLTFHPLLS